MAVKTHSSQRSGFTVAPVNARGLDVNRVVDEQKDIQALPAWVETHANSIVSKAPFSRLNVATDQPLASSPKALKSTAQFLTVRDVAAHLQVSEKTIRRLIKTGSLPVVRFGRSVRIHPEVIEKIMRQNE